MPARGLAVNARVLGGPMIGVRRCLEEWLAAWPGDAPRLIRPPAWASRGVLGHAWEQGLLAAQLDGELLWSPVHSGPVRLERQVVTVHDVVPLDHPEWLTGRFAGWYRRMLPKLVRRARHVIAISAFTRDRLARHCGLEPAAISVVHHGVSDRFRRAAGPPGELPATISDGARPYLVTVSTLEPRKNLATLLRAWQRALPRLPADLELLIAGGQGDAHVFANAGLGQLPERVRLLGFVDDAVLPALYARAQGFVYLSRYEGFGLPPLEAMASGTPSLVSDIPVFAETLGDAALKADPNDVDAVAEALVRLSRDADLRDRLSALGRLQADGYRWETSAGRIAAILDRYRD